MSTAGKAKSFEVQKEVLRSKFYLNIETKRLIKQFFLK